MLIYTNTRSKVKQKLKPKAEREEYQAWLDKHGIDSSKKKKEKPGIITNPVIVSSPTIRKTERIPSLGSFVRGPVNTGQSKQVYSGNNMIGIAAMHKSNLVPIFSSESAKDVSTMRRN